MRWLQLPIFSSWPLRENLFFSKARYSESRWLDEGEDCCYTWQIDFGASFVDDPRIIRCFRLLRTQTGSTITETLYSSKASVPSSYTVEKVHAELQRLVDLCASLMEPAEFERRMAPFMR